MKICASKQGGLWVFTGNTEEAVRRFETFPVFIPFLPSTWTGTMWFCSSLFSHLPKAQNLMPQMIPALVYVMVIQLINSSLMITVSAVALSEFNQEALCQCNSKCKDFGDCCKDYEEVCLKSCKGLCRNGEQVKRENVLRFEIFQINICSVTHANLQFIISTFYISYRLQS